MATFQNQATLTYGDNVTTSNVVTGELQQAISATKYSVTDTYTTDEVLTYVISLVNGGSSPLTDLTVTDNLGGYIQDGSLLVPLDYVEGSLSYYLNGARQGTPVIGDTSPLVITGERRAARDSRDRRHQPFGHHGRTARGKGLP